MNKKILFALLFSSTAVMSYGQTQYNQAPQAVDFSPINDQAKKPILNANEKALGSVIWESDFSTPADWTADNDGQPTFGWTIGTTNNTWYTQNGMNALLNSESDGNFARVFNGDYFANTQATNVTYTLTNTTPIDVQTLGGTELVSLSFYQFGALFNDDQRVQISTDGVNFVDVFTNNERTTFVGNNPSAIYANPELININIAPYIAGNADEVYIRFFWTSRFPSESTLPAWTTFGWFVDDVKLTTNADFDLSVVDTYYGSEFLNYYQIPTTQIAPIDFTANVANNGIQDLTNVVFHADVTGAGTANLASPSVTLPVASSDSLVAGAFTPAAVGNYTVTRSLTMTEVEDLPADNSISTVDFAVTDYFYARDNNTVTGTANGANDSTNYKIGNLFDIWANQNLEGIDVRLTSTSEIGAVIVGEVYSTDGPDFGYLGETEYFEIMSASQLNNVIRLKMADPLSLTANTTYLVVISVVGGNADVAKAGESDPQTSFLYRGSNDTWYYTTNTPIVRMDFDPSLSVNNNEILSGVSVYPNPANESATVEYNLANASNVTITVTDITGKVVETINAGQVNSGANSTVLNTGNYASGIYNVVISSEEASSTMKLVKK